MAENIHEYRNLIAFVKELENLKDMTRTAWTKEGRRESVAEHSWRLTVFAMALENDFPDIDFNKVLRLCLVHDLGEAYEGDVSAIIAVDPEDKLKKEEAALFRLTAPLPESVQNTFRNLWREYTSGATNEAKLVKALDKMETIIQHNQGSNPLDFDYEFNLKYGKEYSLYHPVITAIREIIDRETESKLKRNED